MNKLFFLLVLFQHISHAQSHAHDLNKKLGKGINMGNMFEAPTETEWGNAFKEDYFERIAKLGFNHVRIPIRWDVTARASQIEPYTLNTSFLLRIKTVVDLALKENLYVIVNMHHHESMFTNPDANKAKFLAQWSQIATYFKGYENRLLFEVMNEPNTNLTPDKWNRIFADALTEIRKTNPTRGVLMGAANWGGLESVSSLKIPKDENLILTIHYYDPFKFTHQGADWVGTEANGWLGTKWENTNLERNEIISQFEYLKEFSMQNNLPVHIGEFGAYSKADIDSRVKWSNFLARWFEQQGFSWAYWEFSAGFGIYNPTTNQYLQPLVDALIKNPISAAKELNTTTVYESNFSNLANNWNLNVQQTASANYLISDNYANISISKASTDGWHVQFVKNEIALKKNKRYLVSFEAKADIEVSITNYLGQSSGSYSAYSGYKGFTFSKTTSKFSYSFIMNEADDPKARIVFDVGTKIANIFIKNVKIEEVQESEIVLGDHNKSENILAYPNPTDSEINIEGVGNFQEILLFDKSGQELYRERINKEKSKKLNLFFLSSGQYYLYLIGNFGTQSIKLLKY